MRLRSFHTMVACLVLVLSGITSTVTAQTPLHQQIDELIAEGKPQFEQQAAPLADDATFLRRVTLDLTGTIPTADEVRTFVADSSPDKCSQRIDQLLASPEHARRLQYLFDTMLMERRPGKYVKTAEWEEYLRQSFLENRPWDELVHEILTVDGTDKTTRPAARFLLDRELKSEVVTRDLGRIFLGRDLQCAQCHDHPNVNDYLQRHYHGLDAFLSRSYLFKDPKTKQASIGEKAEGQVSFTSVFTNEEGMTAPRVLDLPEIPDPADAKKAYKVKPAKNVRSVPVYSRRLQLADALTSQNNEAFQKNIVNRLWAMMMGQGLVEPLDMWHSDNPPTHPKIVSLLSKELASHQFNLRYVIRELALTKTYQRSSHVTAETEIPERSAYQMGLLKPLTPEQLAWSMMQATGVTSATLERLQTKQRKVDEKEKAKKAEDPLWQEEALHDALKGNVAAFVRTFGIVGAQTTRFDASADQALFLLNGNTIQSWLAPSGNQLAARLKKLEKPAAVAEELYLSVFSRFPTEKEIKQVTLFLESGPKPSDQDLQQLIWAALSSDEFRFNH